MLDEAEPNADGSYQGRQEEGVHQLHGAAGVASFLHINTEQQRIIQLVFSDFRRFQQPAIIVFGHA
ncbi:hypothetical protein [Pseudarthrobacter sp. SSS035]|uniref:hypothetical protein n=1 Tax=Pseudarthrobacter sp. SSS035 TaxID=2931399 RepID=UPI00200FA7CE|nr:hypothetical protein [Pseudarthrobacter sp. SSS035]